MDALACMTAAWRDICLYATERRTYSVTRERIDYGPRLYADLVETTFSPTQPCSPQPDVKNALIEESDK